MSGIPFSFILERLNFLFLFSSLSFILQNLNLLIFDSLVFIVLHSGNSNDDNLASIPFSFWVEVSQVFNVSIW